MIRSFLFIAFIAFSFASFSQKKDEKQMKKAEDAYNAAMLQLRDGLVRDAVPLLGKAIEYNPNYEEAYLSLAGVYGEMKQYDKAVSTFEKAKAVDSSVFAYLQLSYSIDLAGMGRFEDALAAVNKYLSLPRLNETSFKSGQYRKRSYEFAIDYKKNHPADDYVFAPRNLGDSINSKQSEYYPSFTIDDSLFVFTRRTGDGREDFIESIKTKDNYFRFKTYQWRHQYGTL